MAVLGHDALKEFLAHPDVAKDARHFAALQDGRDRRRLAAEDVRHGAGDDHRRRRGPPAAAVAGEQGVHRAPGGGTPAARRGVDGLAPGRPGRGPPTRAAVSPTCARTSRCRCRWASSANCWAWTRSTTTGCTTCPTRSSPPTSAPRRPWPPTGRWWRSSARSPPPAPESPGDDLTSALIAAREEDGDRLSPHELIGTLMLMIIAGHETTLNLITNAVRALCTHRDQLDLVLAGEASWADVVEETLRWDSPVSYFPFRYPTRDLTIDGTVIPKGDPGAGRLLRGGPRQEGARSGRRTASTSPGDGERPAPLPRPRRALLPGGPAGPDGGTVALWSSCSRASPTSISPSRRPSCRRHASLRGQQRAGAAGTPVRLSPASRFAQVVDTDPLPV